MVTLKLLKLIAVFCTGLIYSQSMLAQSWSITGNSGTNPAVNFLGTTDSKALVFKTNNNERMRIASSGKVGIGVSAPVQKLDVGGNLNLSSGSSLYMDNHSVFKVDSVNKCVFVGNGAGNFNIEQFNTALGYFAMNSNTTGESNTSVGNNALTYNESGSFNTANGSGSLKFNISGFSNTATGYRSLSNNVYGNQNSAFGDSALYSNLTGSFNTAVGAFALFKGSSSAYNTAIGHRALYSTTSGPNTAVGISALYSNTTGSYNTGIGAFALNYNTSGIHNSASGSWALYFNETGDANSADGYYALHGNESGSYNTATGYWALYNNNSSSYNTAIGAYAGDSYANSGYNTFVGYDADASAGSYTNGSAFGRGSRVTATSQVRIGNSAVSSIGGYAGWTNISDGRVKKNVKEDVVGLEFIKKLRPVTYNLDVRAINQRAQVKEEEGDAELIAQKETITYSGFIAQEVEKAAREIGYDFSGVDAPKNENDLYGLRYAEFVVPLVKAVQELSAANDKKDEQIRNLEIANTKIQKQLDQIKSLNDGFIRFQNENVQSEMSLLGQNIPNPFDNSTLIPFRIPKDCENASLMIVEISTRKVVAVIPVSCGESHIQLDAGTLINGAYSYSLYVNRKLIDTKQMELVR